MDSEIKVTNYYQSPVVMDPIIEKVYQSSITW